MAAAPGRVTEAQRATVPARGNEDGDRRERRIAAGRSPAWIIHTPKLEARRQGGLLLRPRARAGNAAARRPASTSTRPSWKRGGKAACCGALCVAKGSLRRCLSERAGAADQAGPLLRPRARAGNAAARRPAVVALGMRSEGVAPALFVGASPERRIKRARSPAWIYSTRPSWKRGGKAACFYVHAPGLETRRQGGLLLRPRARAGNAAARRPASTSTRPGWKRGGKAACCGRTGDA